MVAQNFKRERHEQKQILAACAKCPSILVIFVLCFGSCKQTLSSSCPNTLFLFYWALEVQSPIFLLDTPLKVVRLPTVIFAQYFQMTR